MDDNPSNKREVNPRLIYRVFLTDNQREALEKIANGSSPHEEYKRRHDKKLVDRAKILLMCDENHYEHDYSLRNDIAADYGVNSSTILNLVKDFAKGGLEWLLADFLSSFIVLTAEDRAFLSGIPKANSIQSQSLSPRQMIISLRDSFSANRNAGVLLRLANGEAATDIATDLGVTKGTVLNIRSSFLERGVEVVNQIKAYTPLYKDDLTEDDRNRLRSLPENDYAQILLVLADSDGERTLQSIGDEFGISSSAVALIKDDFLFGGIDRVLERNERNEKIKMWAALVVVLTDAERDVLQRLSEDPKDKDAKVLLRLADGQNQISICRELGISTETIVKIRDVFLEDGFEAAQKAHYERGLALTDTDREFLRNYPKNRNAQVLLQLGEGRSHADVGDDFGISVYTVNGILTKFRSKGVAASVKMTPRVVLTDADRVILQDTLDKPDEHLAHRNALILIDLADGKKYTAIMAAHRVSRTTLKNIRIKFLENGTVATLGYGMRKQPPRVATLEFGTVLLGLIQESPPDGEEQWTQEILRVHLKESLGISVSKATIAKALVTHGVSWKSTIGHGLDLTTQERATLNDHPDNRNAQIILKLAANLPTKEIANEFGIHPNLVHAIKQVFLAGGVTAVLKKKYHRSVELNTEERTALTEHPDNRNAQIVLHLSDGKSIEDVMKVVGVQRHYVIKTKSLFSSGGVAAILNKKDHRKVTLTTEERATLTEHPDNQNAQIILRLAANLTNKEIMSEFGVSRSKVSTVKKVFLAGGVTAVLEKKYHRSVELTTEERATLTERPDNRNAQIILRLAANLTNKEIASELGVSLSRISAIKKVFLTGSVPAVLAMKYETTRNQCLQCGQFLSPTLPHTCPEDEELSLSRPAPSRPAPRGKRPF